MATEQPECQLENHFFIKQLKQKKDYQLKKMEKITKYKMMNKAELQKDQLELLSKEEEILSQIKTIDSYRALFIEGLRKNCDKKETCEQFKDCNEALVNLYDFKIIYNQAKERLQGDQLLSRLEKVKEGIEQNRQLIYEESSSIDQVLNKQGLAKIYCDNQEFSQVLKEVIQKLKETKISSSQFKKKTVEEQPEVKEVSQSVETPVEIPVEKKRAEKIIPIPVGDQQKKFNDEKKRKNLYRNQRRYENREKKGEHKDHNDESNPKVFQKKGETGNRNRQQRNSEKQE